MRDHWVLEKSASGRDEVASRARGLPARRRAILIMVDGRSTVLDLRRRAAGLGVIDEDVRALISDGLIQVLRGTKASSRAVAPAPEAATPAPRPASGRRRSVALARLYLNDMLERMLGHHSDVIRGRIRDATSRAGVLEALAACREVILEMAGAERLSRLEQELLALLPDAD